MSKYDRTCPTCGDDPSIRVRDALDGQAALDEAGNEITRLKAIVARGHDSHDCPNGTSPDGHCKACMDPYWQTQGPRLKAELEQLAAFKREWDEKDGNSPGYNLDKAKLYGKQAAEYKVELEQAKARCGELAEALQDIADPISRLKRECDAKGPGYRLDGGAAVALSQDHNYLKRIATDALNNPGTQKALAIRQAEERVQAVARCVLDEASKIEFEEGFWIPFRNKLSELKTALDEV